VGGGVVVVLWVVWVVVWVVLWWWCWHMNECTTCSL
jgi:hypothetical protein